MTLQYGKCTCLSGHLIRYDQVPDQHLCVRTAQRVSYDEFPTLHVFEVDVMSVQSQDTCSCNGIVCFYVNNIQNNTSRLCVYYDAH